MKKSMVTMLAILTLVCGSAFGMQRSFSAPVMVAARNKKDEQEVVVQQYAVQADADFMEELLDDASSLGSDISYIVFSPLSSARLGNVGGLTQDDVNAISSVLPSPVAASIVASSPRRPLPVAALAVILAPHAANDNQSRAASQP